MVISHGSQVQRSVAPSVVHTQNLKEITKRSSRIHIKSQHTFFRFFREKHPRSVERISTLPASEGAFRVYPLKTKQTYTLHSEWASHHHSCVPSRLLKSLDVISKDLLHSLVPRCSMRGRTRCACPEMQATCSSDCPLWDTTPTSARHFSVRNLLHDSDPACTA